VQVVLRLRNNPVEFHHITNIHFTSHTYFTTGFRNGLMISVSALPHYSWGGMLTLSFIGHNQYKYSAYMFEDIITYGIQHFLPRLLGYLILFITKAFVPQRQFLHKRLPTPLPVLKISTNFISPPLILPFSHKTLANLFP